MLLDRTGVFVGHVQPHEVFKGTTEHLDAAARVKGYDKQIVRIVSDSHGRPTFELFQFHPK